MAEMLTAVCFMRCISHDIELTLDLGRLYTQ